MLAWLKNFFKVKTEKDSFNKRMLYLLKTIKHYKKIFKDIDPFEKNILYVKVNVVDKNILSYIIEINKYLTFQESKIPNILYRNDHITIYFIEFLKDDTGKVSMDSTIYINSLLDYTYSLIFAYEVNKDRKLYHYIMHILELFRTLEMKLDTS